MSITQFTFPKKMKFKQFLFSILLTASLFTTLSFNENDDPHNIGKIEQVETINDTDQIDESSVITKVTPLLEYRDLILYDSKEHKFLVSEHGKQLFESDSVRSGAFVIKANGELIYTGYFVPEYSLRLWFWNLIDPIIPSYNGECYVSRVVLQGGDQPAYPDKRNDPRILEIFRRDHKLIE